MTNHPNRKRAVKEKVAAASPVATRPDHDHDYHALLKCITASFAGGQSRLFMTDAADLNALYLDSLPSERQTHNCGACRHFIARFGGLVAIADDGETFPVMWSPEGVPEFYQPAFAALYDRVKRARVTGVFLSNLLTWGTPTTGEWSHMAVVPPIALLYRGRALTPGQAMAAAKENYKTVLNALSEFTPPMLDEALRIFQADALARSEKFIGPVKWLRTLHDRAKGRTGENILWRAIALAPEGYCHPKASVIAPLLADIVAGLPFAEIKSRFDKMIDPLAYQRPQAPPAAGNIKAAEALFEKMGLAPALERRFARIDDIETIWTPAVARESKPSGGVFGHLKPKGEPAVAAVNIPAGTLTWEKFARLVLPNAEQIEIQVPAHGSFIAMTTAAIADAPRIMKWDSPVAWYVYPGGSDAHTWGLSPGWRKVLAASRLPTMWGATPKPHLSDGVVLVIEGCMDSNNHSGNALFPECLRDDLHGVRSTIEAYSRSAKIGGREGQVACGYDVHKSSANCTLRTLANGAWTSYRIDRWD